MANPITWRNISTPNFSGANRLLSSAADRLSGSLQDIGESLSDTDNQKQEWEQDRQRNTNNILARIAGTNTIEGHNSLQSEITPDALQGQNVDALQILNALNGRDDSIRQDITEQQTFQDTQDARGDRDITGWIKQLVGKKDFGNAQSLINDVQGLSTNSRADLQGILNQAIEAQDDDNWESEVRNNKRQDRDYLLKQRLQTQQLSAAVTGVVNQGLPPEESRQALTTAIADLPADLQTQAYTQLESAWGQRYGIDSKDDQDRLDYLNTGIKDVHFGQDNQGNDITFKQADNLLTKAETSLQQEYGRLPAHYKPDNIEPGKTLGQLTRDQIDALDLKDSNDWLDSDTGLDDAPKLVRDVAERLLTRFDVQRVDQLPAQLVADVFSTEGLDNLSDGKGQINRSSLLDEKLDALVLEYNAGSKRAIELFEALQDVSVRRTAYDKRLQKEKDNNIAFLQLQNLIKYRNKK
ncbi:MAG: hypothetical protein ACRBB6_04185 [Neptuniibacter sp.]